jgi:hypothetical protein
MSEFAYFPSMSDERAARLRVVNRRRLHDDLASRAARILCFTQRDFVILSAGDPAALAQSIGDASRSRSRSRGP